MPPPAADDYKGQVPKTATEKLTPAGHNLPMELSGSGQIDGGALFNACARIVACWRRGGLSERDALEQAQLFAERFRRCEAPR